jgi:superfamily II DNA or RNA helicase
MRLSELFESDFEYPSRSGGESYYRSGAVSIQHGCDTDVEAKVRAESRRYGVEMGLDDQGNFNMWCDCQKVEGSGPCKHVWATLLAAEDRGYLGKVLPKLLAGSEFDLFGNPILTQEFSRRIQTAVTEPRLLKPAPAPPKPPAWRKQLEQLTVRVAPKPGNWPATRQIVYIIDLSASISRNGLVINLLAREPKKGGGWKKPSSPRLDRASLDSLPDPVDRQIIGMLSSTSTYSWMSPEYGGLSTSYQVRHPLSATLMPLIAGSGRALMQKDMHGQELLPLAWDPGGPWQFQLGLNRKSNGNWAITGTLRRDGETGAGEKMDISSPLLVTEGGLVFTRDRVGPLAEDANFPWMAHLRHSGAISAPDSEIKQLLGALLEHPMVEQLEVPEELHYQELRVEAKPCLTIRSPQAGSWNPDRLRAQLWFDYQGRRVPDSLASRGFYDAATATFLVRDLAAETLAREVLRKAGLSAPLDRENGEPDPAWGLPAKKLPAVVRTCVEAGWHIDADGKVFRRPGGMRVEVSSGIDWFDLEGEVDYGETSARLPELLAAVRRGDTMVRLDDGTYGMLPEDWLSRFGAVAGLGQAADGRLRFRRNQAGILDALLAAQPEARCDETFARLRGQLRRFEGVRAAEQPAGFSGQLRDYQREGLGWMHFLHTFGFGGCLADDMGVGKTAQVLALLEHRRALRLAGSESMEEQAPSAPSLVVVPKSLVFNWKQEAARFAPCLRVLDHTGSTRSINGFADYDIVLTTYGTLRRDAVEFKDLEFDYIVLDEAQAIKNADTESAKAVRLLRGRNRLALSGTPVENHLGELWSLFEFLNPGMLGSASVLKLSGSAGRNPSEDTRQLLAHALRPFILRRTKQQVARELPAKSEQTIYCELEGPQRKLYNELRAHYRNTLLHTVEKQGMAKSQMQVLEALLRLRQAACHPGLLDSKRINDPSAKLDLLLTHLEEVIEEGHKALVFSQFTSLLSIVRQRLKDAGITYEYLDGATRDRQQRVERFQNDPACPLFLISLKAGGLGLNLTAAEYVFLLDPWWNPAVEAQAVDRAHRIGQTRQVFAYRLIARDTVEEKVLELQNTKRDLAAAIISEDNSPLRNLRREDLELLLS